MDEDTNAIGITNAQIRELRSYDSATKNHSHKPIDFEKAKKENVSLLNY